VAGDPARGADGPQRSHLEACAGCAGAYHSAVNTAASIGRARRTTRVQAERAARHERLQRIARSVRNPARGWAQRVRLMLLPSFFMFLIVYALGERPSTAGYTLTVEAGEALAGEELIGDERRSASLVPGDWCATGPFSKASLTLHTATLQLAADTRLFVQGGVPERSYLARGQVQIKGSGVLVQHAGTLELEGGEVTLRVGPRVTYVSVHAGTATWTDASGARTLAPGATFSTSL